ncbi:MAG: LacI family transcriptional regulator [Hyphomicrobiales bacterium]|nr:LacI family transcriptional regulator [Hyphomicrobiales bacterium]
MPTRRSTATMKDVALRARVSLATVSRAFAVPGSVSEALTQRIIAAARELNYTINVNARSLRSQSSGLIVVLIPDIGNPFFSVLLQGIEEQARAQGLAILIGDTHGDSELAATYARLLDTRRADGMILLNGTVPNRAHDGARLKPQRYPVVAISERIPGADIAMVGINNRAASCEAVGHLAALGHRRIAHIMGPADNILTHERAQGYRDSILAHGCDMWPEAVQPGAFSIHAGRAAMAKLLDSAAPPTAVFAASDEIAIGAIIEAKARGLLVPDDLSVMGFDDIAYAESYDPALSTINQPRREMGRRAMVMLGALIADPDQRQADVILDHRLVVRASTAPPRVASRKLTSRT